MEQNGLHPRLLREWFMSIQGCFLSSLNGDGDWGRAPMAGERQTLYQSSEKVKSAMQGPAGSSASLCSVGKSMEGSPIGAYLCTDIGGGGWEPSAWTGSEKNLFPCENSQEVE